MTTFEKVKDVFDKLCQERRSIAKCYEQEQASEMIINAVMIEPTFAPIRAKYGFPDDGDEADTDEQVGGGHPVAWIFTSIELLLGTIHEQATYEQIVQFLAECLFMDMEDQFPLLGLRKRLYGNDDDVPFQSARKQYIGATSLPAITFYDYD